MENIVDVFSEECATCSHLKERLYVAMEPGGRPIMRCLKYDVRMECDTKLLLSVGRTYITRYPGCKYCDLFAKPME